MSYVAPRRRDRWRRTAARRRDRRQQEHRADRHGRPGQRVARPAPRRRRRSGSSRTPSSCARARRSRTSCSPTASSLGATDPAAAEARRASCTRRFGCAGHDHRHAHRRDDQVRLERLPGHQDLASSTRSPQICERLGADVEDGRPGHGLRPAHRRRASSTPGIGYGGSCFPKDVKALEHMATGHGAHPQLLRAVMEINRDQRAAVVQQAARRCSGDAATARRSACSGWPSSRTPTTCATRRRST